MADSNLLMPSLTIQWYTIVSILFQRQIIHNRIASSVNAEYLYDYIVVGAGSAGSIVACRLAEIDKNRVLLLEAGGAQNALLTDQPAMYANALQQLDISWNYVYEPQSDYGVAYLNRTVSNVKGRVLGGSSTVNLVIYNRGFDNIAEEFGANGWSYDEVLPYFKKHENNSDPNVSSIYHGRNGPVGVSTPLMPDEILSLIIRAANEQGFNTIDVNGKTQLGVMLSQSTIKHGLRSSTANAYLEFSQICPKLTILANSFVTKINIKNNTNGIPIAYGVEFVRNNQTFSINATKEVLISAGAEGSPKILMLSGIGHKNHLKTIGISPVWADLPVGDNYGNHPAVMNNILVKNNSLINSTPVLELQQLYNANVNGTGYLSQLPFVTIYLISNSNSDKDWPDILLLNPVGYKNKESFATLWRYGDRADEWNTYFRNLKSYNYVISAVICARPRSVGTVRLRSSNPNDLPKLTANFLQNNYDKYCLLEGLAYSFYLVEETSLSQYLYVNPNPIPGCEYCSSGTVWRCVSYLICMIQQTGMGILHNVGSARMGNLNRSDVVVDERLRVKNVKRLRVIDLSVFPRIINAPTNAAAMMVGEKGAQMILEDN